MSTRYREVALAVLGVGWVLTVATVTPLVLGHGASAPQISRAYREAPAPQGAHVHYVLLPHYSSEPLPPRPRHP